MTLATQQPPKLTRQGVPDLNPRAVNGKRPSCPHYRDPHAVAVERKREFFPAIDIGGNEVSPAGYVNVYYCLGCGAQRWIEE